MDAFTVAHRISLASRLIGARVRARSLIPALVVIVAFKLALSDGGRYLPALSFAQIATVLTAGALAAAGAVHRSMVTGPLAAVVAVTAMTVMWSVKPLASVLALLRWLMLAGITVSVGSTLEGPTAVRRFADAMAVVAGWLCGVALFVFWGAGNPTMRWYSTFYWPNPFAGFLLLALPVSVSRYLHAATAREALAHGVLSLLLGMSLVLTYSRGAWLSLLVAAPLAVVVLRPPSWSRAASRTVVLAAVLAVVVVALTRGAGPSPGGELLGRAASVADPADQSVQGRLHFWRSAWAIFLDHPAGTGAGTFGSVHAAYQQDARFYATDAHNLYLQTAAEMGVPGLAALAVLLASVGATWRRALQQTRGTELYPVVAGAGVALLAFFVHSGVEMDWMFPANPAAAFALVGLLAARDSRPRAAVVLPAVRWSRVGAAVLALAAATASVFWYAAGREFIVGQRVAREGRWSQAAQVYARAIRLNPLEPRYLAAQAVAFMQMNPAQPARAEAAIRRAMRLDRANASHPLQLVWLLSTQPGWASRLADAEVLVTRAIELDPLNRPEAYRRLGRLYLERGEVERAERTYREAAARYRHRGLSTGMMYLLLWPEVAGLNMDWAALLMSQGRTDEAIVVLQDTLRDDPQWGPAYVWLARAYLQVGRAQDAGRTLQEGMDQRPNDVTLWIRWRSLQPRRPLVWAQ